MGGLCKWGHDKMLINVASPGRAIGSPAWRSRSGFLSIRPAMRTTRKIPAMALDQIRHLVKTLPCRNPGKTTRSSSKCSKLSQGLLLGIAVDVVIMAPLSYRASSTRAHRSRATPLLF